MGTVVPGFGSMREKNAMIITIPVAQMVFVNAMFLDVIAMAVLIVVVKSVPQMFV
jgi:hypothetical protein